MTRSALFASALIPLLVSGASVRRAPAPRRNGIVRTWWPGGTLRSEIAYADGDYDGVYRTWYQTGRPFEFRHFRHGHEEGLQQAWSENGALYINYDMRNGRRFGLLNSTPCLPVGANAAALPYYGTRDFTPQWTPVAHRIAPFALTTQRGRRISNRDLDGRIHVASFIYTRCAAVCPLVVRQLTRVQQAVRSMSDVVLVSYTVTPDTDTPAVLAAFGRARGIDPDRWWLVTGDKAQIYGLARTSYFADDPRVSGDAGTEAFLHTEKVLLVDGTGRLRGIYNGTQPHEIDQLIADIAQLHRAVD